MRRDESTQEPKTEAATETEEQVTAAMLSDLEPDEGQLGTVIGGFEKHEKREV